MIRQAVMVARQGTGSGGNAPGWLLAAAAEKAAKEALFGLYSEKQSKNVCPGCFTVRSTSTLTCFCQED